MGVDSTALLLRWLHDPDSRDFDLDQLIVITAMTGDEFPDTRPDWDHTCAVEGTFLLPYLCLMREDAPQREHALRELFNALRYMVKTGVSWRYLPNDFPPWASVYQQAHRWLQSRCFEQIAHELWAVGPALAERQPDPSAVIFDARTLQSTPESGGRAGNDGHKKKNGSKLHAAVDPWVTCWPDRHPGGHAGAGPGRRPGRTGAGGDRR
jgi:transposase